QARGQHVRQPRPLNAHLRCLHVIGNAKESDAGSLVIVNRKGRSPIAIAWLADSTGVDQVLGGTAQIQFVAFGDLVAAVRGLQLEPFTGRIRGKATLYMRVPEERDRGTRTLKLTFSIFSGEQIFILIEQRAMHATHVRSFG